MIASLSFVLIGNLICNISPKQGKFLILPSLTYMSKHQIPKRIPNNAIRFPSSIMVLQTNTMTCREISD